jgi:hypothetical protein
MNTTGIVGIGVAALVVGAVVLLTAGQLQVGAINLLGGTGIEEERDLPWAGANTRAVLRVKREYSFNNGMTRRREWHRTSSISCQSGPRCCSCVRIPRSWPWRRRTRVSRSRTASLRGGSVLSTTCSI